MLKKVVKAVLFNLSKLIVIAFFLLVSEQVFAHENHSFFEFQPAGYNQSFFDDEELIETPSIEETFTNDTVCKLFSIREIQQVQNKLFFAFSADTTQERIIFQNHILTSQPNHAKSQAIITLQQIEEECNCLNDCSCLECQCADCPMATSCHATSMVLLDDIITVVQPIHESLVSTTNYYFSSQPHTLPFRPPIIL